MDLDQAPHSAASGPCINVSYSSSIHLETPTVRKTDSTVLRIETDWPVQTMYTDQAPHTAASGPDKHSFILIQHFLETPTGSKMNSIILSI